MVDEQTHNDDIFIITSQLLSAASTGFFLVFAASIVADLFPLELLKPQWQINFIARLLAAGSFALLGFCLLHISLAMNQRNVLLKARLESVRKLAVAATLGFLLLIPLQGFATWRSFRIAETARVTQMQTAKKRLAPLKDALRTATSPEDLQAKIEAVKDFKITLQPEDLQRPLPELREAILANMDRAENLYFSRINPPNSNQIWSALQSAFRTLIASLGYAFAFAAGAQASDSSNTLLESFFDRWVSQTNKRKRRQKLLIP